jgi:hypothetical protein
LSAATLTANLIGIKSQLNTLLPFDLRAVANTLGLNGEIRAAKAGNRQGRIISWMLLLTAALGLANPRPEAAGPGAVSDFPTAGEGLLAGGAGGRRGAGPPLIVAALSYAEN